MTYFQKEFIQLLRITGPQQGTRTFGRINQKQKIQAKFR